MWVIALWDLSIIQYTASQLMESAEQLHGVLVCVPRGWVLRLSLLLINDQCCGQVCSKLHETGWRRHQRSWVMWKVSLPDSCDQLSLMLCLTGLDCLELYEKFSSYDGVCKARSPMEHIMDCEGDISKAYNDITYADTYANFLTSPMTVPVQYWPANRVSWQESRMHVMPNNNLTGQVYPK